MRAIFVPTTLRSRLAVAVAIATLTAVALLAAATVLVVRHELVGSLDGALRDRARQVAQLAVTAPPVLSTPGALDSTAAGRQIVVEVIDRRGRLLARSLALGARLLPEDPLARAAVGEGRSGFEDIALGGRRFRMYVAPIAEAAGPAAGGAVLAASDTTDIARTSAHLGLIIGLIGAAVCVAVALASAALTRRGLRPLGRLASDAAEIERTADPSRRLQTEGAAEEIAQLTGVLNRMLAALERSRDSERRFLADASHELRTPVTALLGNVEYAVRHGADEEVLDDLRRDAGRLARLVDDLLVLERIGTVAPDEAAVDLSAVAREVAAGHEEVDVYGAEGVSVSGDRDALRRLVGNLAENALVHGPAGGRVTMRVDRDGSAVRLSVSDEGPGPAPDERERVFERFWRGSGTSERPGSGLGLSIVRAIAEGHGAALTVEGSTFTVEFRRGS